MPDHLSPSSIGLYQECERCFWLKMNEGVRRPSGPFPSLPSGMDRILKEHFDRYRAEGEQPPELAGTSIDAVPYPDAGFVEACRDWKSEPVYEDAETGVVLKGGVDELLETEDGDIIVLDYKTRGWPPRDDTTEYYVDQLNLYNLILRENGHDTADVSLLLYYYPDTVREDGDVVFHTQPDTVPVDIEGAKDLVRDAVEVMEGDIPEHSDDCDFCDWNVIDHDS